jgi:predicted  nucleic acid-binding Zn-ribbon protein
MAKAVTPIDPIEASRQISDKAQAEIAELQAQLPALQQKVVDLQEEAERLTQAIEVRKARIADITHSLQVSQTAHSNAVAYASVASGTIGEKDAIAQAVRLKKTLDDTQSLLNKTKQEYLAADDQAQARLEENHAEHEAAMTALHDLYERINAVESVKQRSLAELGEHLHASLLKEYEAYRTHTEEARAALVAAQMDEQTFLTQAADQMKQWPEHRTFKEALGVDNPLVRILQADLAYLDQILTDSAEFTRQYSLPNSTILPPNTHWNWSEMLLVPYHDMFYAGFGSDMSIMWTKERRERVADLLKQCKQVP